MRKLLVIGCIRSGTTMLASMLGAHSMVNMLDECYSKDVDLLIGKKYQGNKVVIPHIWHKRRGSRLRLFLWDKFSFLITMLKWGRIKCFISKGSLYSIQDYIDMGAKIVFILRDKDSNINSIIRRQNLYPWHAKRILLKSYKIAYNIPSHRVFFGDLTNEPERTMKDICEFLEILFEPKMLKSSGMNDRYKNHTIERKI